jgi:hypothetical protein
MDCPHDHRTDYDAPAVPSEAELRAAMEESDRDAEAGRSVPVADFLAELDDVASRIEARRRAAGGDSSFADGAGAGFRPRQVL